MITWLIMRRLRIPRVMGYDIIWRVRVLIILYCSWGRAHATCLGRPIEATISVEKIKVHSKNRWCFEGPYRVLHVVPNTGPYLVLRGTPTEGASKDPLAMVL